MFEALACYCWLPTLSNPPKELAGALIEQILKIFPNLWSPTPVARWLSETATPEPPEKSWLRRRPSEFRNWVSFLDSYGYNMTSIAFYSEIRALCNQIAHA